MTDSAGAIVQQAIQQGLTICLDANCIIYFFNGDQPWAERLRPVFEAGDQRRIRLVTSTVTLAEVLASGEKPTREADREAYLAQMQQVEAGIRRYFDVVPVSDRAGVYAAGIRRQSSVKASDALQAAATGDTNATLFITNDEQLVRAPLQQCKAVYLTDLALEWLEEELTACIDTSAPVDTLAPGPLNMALGLAIAPGQPMVTMEPPLPAADFPQVALQLAHLVAGSSAVVGLAEGAPGDERLIGLRVLPSGRPWRLPEVPREIERLTNKRYGWHEHEPATFVTETLEQLRRFNQSAADRGAPERRLLCLLADVSRLDAEAAVNAKDSNPRTPMQPHRKRTEMLLHYLAPFRPLAKLWDSADARLWRGEAGNAHRLDTARFAAFWAHAENVLGKGGAL
jgi:predicted nucleic acid-binding protein